MNERKSSRSALPGARPSIAVAFADRPAVGIAMSPKNRSAQLSQRHDRAVSVGNADPHLATSIKYIGVPGSP